METFDPANRDKYKKVEDLPKQAQHDYVEHGEGFVRRTAAAEFEEAKRREKESLSFLGEKKYKEGSYDGTNDVVKNALGKLEGQAAFEYEWVKDKKRYEEIVRNFPAQLAKWRVLQRDYLKESLSDEPEAVSNRVIAYLKSISTDEFELPTEVRNDELFLILCTLEKDFPYELPTEYFKNLDTEASDKYFFGKGWSADVRKIPEVRSAFAQAALKVFFEKRTPKEFLKFMPGHMSDGGFLGWGETFDGTVRQDKAVLDRLGITKDALAQKLLDVLSPAKAGSKWNSDQFEVSIKQYLGAQTCPCCGNGDPSILGDRDFQIMNKKTGDSIQGPGLLAHMIKDHSFFEGKQSPYRVNPEHLYRVLYGAVH